MIVIENLIHNGVPISLSVEGVGLHGLLFERSETKTRWMDLLAGCDCPAEGDVLLERKESRLPSCEQKKWIGYVPADLSLYEDMTVDELLDFFGEAKGIAPDKRERQMKEAKDLMGIRAFSHRLISSLSAQGRRRVIFAQAVLGNPSVIVIDEPYGALSGEQKRDVESLLKTLGRHKPIVLGSTSADILALCQTATVIGEDGIRFSGEATSLAEALSRAGETYEGNMRRTEPVSLSSYFGFCDKKEEERV